MEDYLFWDHVNAPWGVFPATRPERGRRGTITSSDMVAAYSEKCHELHKKLRDTDVLVEIPDEHIARVISGIIWRGQFVYDSIMMLPGRVLDVDINEFYDFHSTIPQSILDTVDEEFPWE